MENLPEDQRDEDSSSPEPDPPEPVHQEQALEVIEGGVAALNIQQPLEIVQNVQPLLLRHPSVSSLDESSQKFRSTHNSLISQIQDNRPLYKNTSHPQRAFCQLNGMREDGMLTDVVLVAAGREVFIYYLFFCAISQNFWQQFFMYFFRSERTKLFWLLALLIFTPCLVALMKLTNKELH